MYKGQLKIAITIPVYNRAEITLNCLKQLQSIETEGATIQFIIVDDGSTDGTANLIKTNFPDSIVLTGNGNLWWTGAINMGAEYALKSDFDYILCLNDDLEFDPDFINELIKVAIKNPLALVSSIKLLKTEDAQEKINTTGFIRKGSFLKISGPLSGQYLKDVDLAETLDREMLTGASLLIPCTVFSKIGFFDATNYPHNWGDFEFTLRASLNGFSCLVATQSKIYVDGYNPNYYKTYAINSSRLDYLKNLFESHKYNYGFAALKRQCFMHRPLHLAIILFSWKLMGIVRGVVFKIFMPGQMFKAYIEK